MMPMYQALPTARYTQLVTAQQTGGPPITLQRMAIGDGNGSPVNVHAGMTTLVRELAESGLDHVLPHPDIPSAFYIDATFDIDVGGFMIREVGIKDANGELMFVASAYTTKGTTAENQEDLLTLGLVCVIAPTANVTIAAQPATGASQTWVQNFIEMYRTHVATPARPYWIACNGILQNNPPSAPPYGNTYVVGPEPTGSWGGKAFQIAQYLGADAGWQFTAAPLGTRASTVHNTDSVIYRRVSSGWRADLAAPDEHLVPVLDGDLYASPLGVKGMIDARFPASGFGAYYKPQDGAPYYAEIMDIHGLPSKPSNRQIGTGWEFPAYMPAGTNAETDPAKNVKLTPEEMRSLFSGVPANSVVTGGNFVYIALNLLANRQNYEFSASLLRVPEAGEWRSSDLMLPQMTVEVRTADGNTIIGLMAQRDTGTNTAVYGPLERLEPYFMMDQTDLYAIYPFTFRFTKCVAAAGRTRVGIEGVGAVIGNRYLSATSQPDGSAGRIYMWLPTGWSLANPSLAKK